MFKRFKFIDFKGFGETHLDASPLTIIIGANASGKSNAMDGIRLLSRMADSADLSVILDGTRGQDPGIRGGSQGLPRKGAPSFGLGCMVEEGGLWYDYRVLIGVRPRITFVTELLSVAVDGANEVKLFDSWDENFDSGDIQVSYYSGRRGNRPKVPFLRNHSALSQVPGRIPADGAGPKRVRAAADALAAALRGILILDPVPQLMRDWVHKSRTALAPNAENVSAVVANLIKDPDTKTLLLSLLQDLPEQQIVDIKSLEAPTGDVMLQLVEQCGADTVAVDARNISDGTLRFLAVIAALIGEPSGTTLVVEEIDNGLHPSRVGKLLTALRETGLRRGIQVIATTHNPALLNALEKDDLQGVVVCYRDSEEGDSRFVPWLQVDAYPALMVRAKLGDLVSTGKVQEAVRGKELPGQQGQDWIKENRP